MRYQLSKTGQERRASMLVDLQQHMATRQQRRRRSVALVSVCGLLIVCSTLFWLNQVVIPNPDLKLESAHREKVADPAVTVSAIENRIVGNLPGVLDRYVVSSEQLIDASDSFEVIDFQEIDNEQLQNLITEQNLPVAVGTIGNETVVIPYESETTSQWN